jgi:hypothetical protein
MARNTTRKTARAKTSETDTTRGGQTKKPSRSLPAARPRRPNRLLLVFSGALFLIWLVLLVLLTIRRA